MAGVIEELVISLGLDASQLQAGVQNVAQQLGPGLQSAAQAGAASVGELVTQLTEAAQEAESLGETSEFIAGLTEGLTEAAHEAETLGESTEAFSEVVSAITEAAHEAEALGDTSTFIEGLSGFLTEAAQEAEGLGEALSGAAQSATQAVEQAQNAGGAVSEVVQNAAQAVEQAQNAGGAVSEVVQNATQAAGQAAQGASGAVDAVMNTLGDLSQHTAAELRTAIASLQGFYEALRSDASLTDAERAAGMEAARQAIGELEQALGHAEGLQALHQLGLRSTEEIQQAIERLREGYEAIRNDASLTDRDRAAGMEQTRRRIEQLEDELQRGIPQAADRGFAGAEAAAGRFRGFISSIWAQIAGPLAGIFAIGGSISSYISGSTEAGELAEKLNVDVEEIQIWNGAIERAGGSAAGLQQTIQKLTKAGKDNGDVFGTLLNLAEQAERLGKERFEQKAKELELDEDTIEVLLQGRKELETHLKRQKELGVYTKEDAEQSKKFKQALSDLGTAWNSLTAFIGRFAVPIMKLAADVLTDVVVFLRQHTPFVVAAITLIGAALAVRLLPPLKELPKAVLAARMAFARLPKAIRAGWFPLIAIIAALALLFDDFWTYVTKGDSEFAEFWAIFGTGPEILAALNAAWEETKAVMAAVADGLRRFLRYWYDLMQSSGAFAAWGQSFKGTLQIIKGIFSGDMETFKEGVANLFAGLGKSLVATFKVAGTMLQDLGKQIAKLWESVWKDIELPDLEAITKYIWDTFTGLFTRLKEWIANWFKNSLGNVFGGIGELGAALAGEDEETIQSVGAMGKETGDKAGKLIAQTVEENSGAKAAERFNAAMRDALAFDGIFDEVEPEAHKAGDSINTVMGETAETAKGGFNAAWSATADFAVREFQGAASTINGILSGVVSNVTAQVGALALDAQAMAGNAYMVPAFAGVRAQNAGNSISNNTSSVNIGTMNVATRATDANGVARGMRGALNKNRLVQAGQSGVNQK